MQRTFTAAVVATLMVLAGCSGSGDEDTAFPFAAATPTETTANQNAPAPDTNVPNTSAVAPEPTARPTPVAGDFCAAWEAMTTAGRRYASKYIAVGADELIATTDAARELLPIEAPPFAAQQIEMFAYQGEAGLLLRDMSGDALERFQQDIDQRYRDDLAKVPGRVEDFLWASNYCPDLPEPKRYFELAADLVVSEPIMIAEPPDRAEVAVTEFGVVFQGDPDQENVALGSGYVGRNVEPDGSSSSLSITRQSDLHPDEWPFGQCTFNASTEQWAAEQDRVLYLEPTANGTTIVITFRPQLSDLAPAIFSLSLVTTEHAPTELGQAGFCNGDFAVWDTQARVRYEVTGSFNDAITRESTGFGFPQAFHSIDELMAAPGANEILHAMRTMEFGFLSTSE